MTMPRVETDPATIHSVNGKSLVQSAEETKEEKFERIAPARIERAVKQIRMIANMGRSGNYAYTEADVEQIHDCLAAEVAAMRLALMPRQKSIAFKFRR